MKIIENNADSTCVLIGQQVCFHSARKLDNLKEIKYVLRGSVAYLGKVFENSQAGESRRLCFEYSLICSRILPIVPLGFGSLFSAR